MFKFLRKNRRITPKPRTKSQSPKSAISSTKSQKVKTVKPPKTSKLAALRKKPKTAKKTQPPNPLKADMAARKNPKARKPTPAKKIKRTKSARPGFSLELDWATLAQGLAVAGVSALFLLALPDFRGLWEPWESAWALAAREMLQSGHWYHPTLNGWAFEARTPLAYWPLMASYKLFGVSELTARLPGIIWASLIILAVHQLTAGLHDKKAGLLAGVATLLSFSLIAAARVCLVDLGLVFALVLSLGGLWSVYLTGQGPALRFWLGCGLAFALGGAGALALSVICALALGLVTRSLAWWRGLVCWPGIALFLLITQGALFLVGLNNPAYWDYYLLNPINSDSYFLSPLYLALGAFPWLCLLPWAWWVSNNQKEYYRGSAALPLVWMAVAWMLAPVLHMGALALAVLIWVGCAVWLGPALATLVKGDWTQAPPDSLRRCLTGLSLLLLAVALGYVISPWLFTGVYYETLGASLLLVPVMAAGLSFLVFRIRNRIFAGLAAPILVILAICIGMGAAMAGLDREHSLKQLINVVQGELTPSDVVVSYGYNWPGLSFYVKRPVNLTAGKPLKTMRHLRVPAPGGPRHISQDKFLGYMKSDTTRVLAVARTEDYRALEKKVKGMAGLLMFDWARRGDWVLFSNRPL